MPPKIDKKKCVGCGSCVTVCPAGVLKVVKGKLSIINVKACLDCRACEAACRNKALSFS